MKIACAAFALLLAARFSGIAWPSTWSSARLVAALLFRGPKIVNSVSYRQQRSIRRGRRTPSHTRTDPARVRHGIAGGVGRAGIRSRTASPLGAVAPVQSASPSPQNFRPQNHGAVFRAACDQIERRTIQISCSSIQRVRPVGPLVNTRCGARWGAQTGEPCATSGIEETGMAAGARTLPPPPDSTSLHLRLRLGAFTARAG